MHVNLSCPAHIEAADWRRACEITERTYVKVIRALPWWIDREGVWSEALLMLWRKGEEFDPGRRVRFSTFCAPAVHGAMIEAIRRESPFTRQQHAKQKADDDYAAPWVSLDAPLAEDEPDVTLAAVYPDPGPGPEQVAAAAVDQERLAGLLWPLVVALPDRYQQALTQRYVDELTFRKVGVNLGVSESRGKQLVDEGLGLLVAALQETSATAVLAAGLDPTAVPAALSERRPDPSGYVSLARLAQHTGVSARTLRFRAVTGKFAGACKIRRDGERIYRWYVPASILEGSYAG